MDTPIRHEGSEEHYEAQHSDQYDQLLQDTCRQIVTMVAELIDSEHQNRVKRLVLDSGIEYGRQILIDAAEGSAMMNVCRLTILVTDLNPEAEVVRIEYEHDKKTNYGTERAYSVQSVRQHGRTLQLLENFLADAPEHVREADFRPILSETYAQESVLKSLRQWTQYRSWQIQHGL